MRRNLLSMVMAVGGVVAAPAVTSAQSSTVTFYGRIVLNYNYVDYGGQRVNADYMNSHDSIIGFRGEEKLGRGLSAWFQCESSPAVHIGYGGTCARNSGIGFKGGFGNLFFGGWDTPMRRAMFPARPFSTSGVFGMGGLLWNEFGVNVTNGFTGAQQRTGPAVGPVPPYAVSFTRRQANTTHYYSPDWNGFQFMAAFSAANEVAGTPSPPPGTKPRLWGTGASYSNGPLYLGAGYEKHKDYNPAQLATGYVGGTDSGWSLAGAYRLGNFRLSALYSDIHYRIRPGQALDAKGWGVYGDWHILGPHNLRLGYTRANDVKGNSTNFVNSYAAAVSGGIPVSDTGARLYAIQYYHTFSKRTEVNFGHAYLDNGRNSRHRLQTVGQQSRNPGHDQSAWEVGVVHRF